MSLCKYQGRSLWAAVYEDDGGGVMCAECGGGDGGVGDKGEGRLEMITINKGLAGVIPDFIRQQEMESRWQGSLSLFGETYMDPMASRGPTPSHSKLLFQELLQLHLFSLSSVFKCSLAFLSIF